MAENEDERLAEYVKNLGQCVKEEEEATTETFNPLLKNKDFLRQIGESLLDTYMLDIIDNLRDLQFMTESNLLEERKKILEKHSEQKKKYKEDLGSTVSSSISKQLLSKFDKKLEEELKKHDKLIVASLDERLKEQQVTLQRAGLPGFVLTMEPEDVKFQMEIMRLITRLEVHMGRIKNVDQKTT